MKRMISDDKVVTMKRRHEAMIKICYNKSLPNFFFSLFHFVILQIAINHKINRMI